MTGNDDARYYRPPPKQLHPAVRALRRRRYELGLQAKEVAARTGYSLSVVRQWECGQTTPSLPALTDWAQALGMKIEVRDEQ